MSREFWNRDSLYQEVWATPMAKLAKKYGISDVGLAKICRKLAIPVPGRGYWAKQEAGQKVEPLPLPVLKEEIRLPIPVPQPPAPKLSDFATQPELALLEQLEGVDGEVALKRGDLSHPLIIQARAVLGKARADDRKILWAHESYLDIRVSKERLDRALRIMAGIISIVEDAGFRISVETRDRKHVTVAKLYGEEIRFGLVEKIDRIELSAPPKGGVLERVLTFAGKPVALEPSGRLSITVWSYYGSDRKKWTDGKSSLEQQLSKIVAGLMRLALADRADTERRAAQERERRRIAEEEARVERLVRAEESKVRALVEAAADWSHAEQIRALVSATREAAIRNGESVESGSRLADWITWAERQADRMDPLSESPPSILDGMAEPEPSNSSDTGYGYREPDPPFRFPKPIWRMK